MGDIVISGGGETTVATDELLADAARLASFSANLDGWRQTLRSVPPMPPLPHPAGEPFLSLTAQERPDAHLEFAGTALLRAAAASRQLSAELTRAAENYGMVERAATAGSEGMGALAGYALGSLAPLAALWLIGPVMASALGFAVSTLFTGSPQKSWRALQRRIGSHRELLSDPRFVELVRLIVSSSDEAMLGAAQIPLPLALALGDRGLGWFGLHGASREVVAAGRLNGMLQETPVVVHRASPAAPSKPPSGFSDLAARIPSSRAGGPQVTIERYESDAGEPRWMLYVGGTVDPGLTAAGEPWDDTSNVQAIAALDPASLRATLQAMKDAGIKPGDQVFSVGYSQGGIIATDVVERGGFTNAGLVTFGSPSGQMPVPAGVPTVAVEVNEDVVPALGGAPLAPYQGGLDRIVVRRSAYDGAPPPGDEALPAHNIHNYRDTAALMDAAHDRRLAGVRDTLADFVGSNPGTATPFRADRVPAAG